VLVGQPVSLGPGWKKLFGKMQVATLACIEGGCEFRKISYEVLREAAAAPPGPPVASVDPPKPPEVKPASGTAKTPVKSPVVSPKKTTPKKGGGKKGK
jgi:hypothetical protein